MSKGRQAKRSKVKPFIKVVNYNHIMPTRYTLELEGLKGAVTNDTFKEVSQREDAKKNIKKALEERYQSGKNKWFFTPLSMMQPQSLLLPDTQTNTCSHRILNDSSTRVVHFLVGGVFKNYSMDTGDSRLSCLLTHDHGT
jgi:hypothetical protein